MTVDFGTASTSDLWRIKWRVLSARRECRSRGLWHTAWPSVYETFVHQTSGFQAARGSDGLKMTPASEIEASM